MADATSFDIFEWYPAYQSCQRYFLDKAQHDANVHAVAALVNIRLPFQTPEGQAAQQAAEHNTNNNGRRGSSAGPSGSNFAYQSMQSPTGPPSAGGFSTASTSRNTLPPPQSPHGPQSFGTQHQQSSLAPSNSAISLIPFVRRLVVTGFDTEGVLHGFFGPQWRQAIGPLQECERRNYLFTAKSVGWAKVKHHYDMGPNETVPFLRPLQGVRLAEIEAAERGWSSWLAMEDWMVGPRAPEAEQEGDQRLGHGNNPPNPGQFGHK